MLAVGKWDSNSWMCSTNKNCTQREEP
ncbi:protein of unknown function [Cyanobium sp. NIES-981]|nr:protein of unknown function [Cyanobium sp. NIES-981]